MSRYLIAILLLVTLALGAACVAMGAPLNPPGVRKTNPELLSITPGNASPGETILVKTINTPADKTKVEIWFTLAANTTVQGTIGSTTEPQGTVIYYVKVPGDDSTASYQGPLYVKIKEDGRTTNSRNFRVTPVMPKISSHSPQYGEPGKTTTFKGVNFKPTDEATLSNYSGTVPVTYRSATEIAITLPSNYPTTNKFISVILRRKSGSATLSTGPYILPLDPKLLPESKTGTQNTGQKVESGQK